jgi:hypothetical protein
MGDQSQIGRSNALIEPERHELRIDPRRSMKAISHEVEELLKGLDESSRRCGALIASELMAQVVGRRPGWQSEPVGLTVQLRKDVVRMEATGPVTPSIGADQGSPNPLADWGRFILDRLADRWGVSGDSRRALWAEIKRTP